MSVIVERRESEKKNVIVRRGEKNLFEINKVLE